MATNLRDRGYGSSMDAYNANKQKVEERKKQEKTTGPVSTLRLPQVNSTTPSRAASTSAPIQTQRFYNPNSTFNTTGHSGGRGTPRITPEEFMRSTAMQKLYGNYNNYANGIQVTGSGFSDPNLLFNDNDDNRRIAEADAIQNKMDQAMNVVADNFGQKAAAYERWYRTATNNVREKDGKFYRDISDEQLAEGDRLYADYEQALNTYSQMEDAHRKASANTALTYSDISGRRQKWYDSIRDVPEIDLEEKDIKSRMEILQNERLRIENESANAKLQTLHGITTAPGLETVMNSTDDLNRIDRQLEELQKQLDLLEMEKGYSRYFKWQELKDNDMPVSARRLQGGAPSWLHKIISGTATQEDIQQAINEGNINPSNIAEMLDDEKETYLSIWEQYGPAKANEYVDELERYGNIRDSLNTRRRMTDEAKLRNWVKKGSPFGRQFAASVLTVLASPMKAFSYVGQGADYLFSGEMTKDADYNVFSYAPNAVTAQIGENITKWGEEHGSKWVQKWGEFGYQTALSIATFLYTTALTGGFGLSPETMYGVELYNQGYRTAEAVSAYKAFKTAEALSLGLMGTEAAADAVMQAKDRGLDDGQAFWMGTAAGAIEILTEKFSVENLLEGVGDRSRLLSFLKSMFTEGSEEVASDFSNMIVDSLVAKDKSEFNQAVKNYMKEYGVSKQEALKAVWTEQLKSIGLSGLGGAISGGFMGGGNIVGSNVSNLFNRSAITSQENVANIIGRAQGLNEWSEGARSASALQRKLDAGERFTIREVLKARNAIETDKKTDPKYVGALIEAAQDYGDSDAKKQADKLQTKLDNGKVKVEDVENLEEAIDLERLVDPNREDLQTALKYGETADQKSEAYKLTKGIRDKIAAGEKLSLEEVSAAESAVNTAKATSAEGLKSTIESGLASDQNSPAYKSAQQLQSKLDSGTEITLAEVNEAKRAVRAAENAAYKSLDPNVVGKYLVTENGRKALTDAATILKNSTSQSDVRRGNEILQAIKDGNLDAKAAGEVFLRSQKILENTEKQTARVLQPREVTADMDAYDRSAAELGISVEEASRNKAILQAFGVEGKYKSFENNNLSAYYDRSTGKVYINANAQNPGLSLIAHEVTHSFENTAGYKKLADLVFSQSKDLNADLQRITQEYKDAGINLDDDGARSEMVSEFVEQHMFNDEKFIKDVVSTDRSLAQKFLAAIDNLLAKLGNKNAQQRQLLRHARDLWAEALQQRKNSDKAKAKIAEKRSEAKKLSLPAVEAKAAAVKKTEGPNLPKAESRKIQTANAELNQYGINIDSDSGAAVSYSIRTAPTTVDEIKLATDRLVNAGFDRADAENWLKSLTSVSSVIMQNMQELDYEADERYTWLKTNSEYTQGSVDFNNNCPKRAQFTAVFDRLQQMMPDRVFSASDYETIRQILIKHNISVTCGPCFVEDRRQHTGEIAQKFIEQLKNGELKDKFRSKIGNDTYVPTQYDLVTYEGLRGLYDSHRGIHDAFVAFNNARGMQAARLLEGLAEYNNQIKKWNKRTISSKNSKGGLRIFSLSDADPRNMIDMIQIVTDSAEKGLMIQGYTKKPWFAKFIKDTGVRILRSHIPAGNGVRNGKLVFDNVEGINTNDPDYFDATNERNIGDTVIGINDEMIRIAMADPSIDQIIPFHTQLAKDIRDQKKIGHWTPYNGLEDRNVSDGKKADKQINIYKDVLQAWEKKGTPITNRQEFVEAFLQVCDERGLIPRFDKFLNVDENGKYVYTPGYEKFLVDYKLFDRTTGEIIPQEAVKPIFDDAYNQSVLENYVKGAKNLPKVSEDVFDEIKRHFTDDKLSLPKAESKQFAKAEARWEAGEKLTESQFYSFYSAHKLDLRRQGNVLEQIESIKRDGFKGYGGFGHNLMPTRQTTRYPTIDKYNMLLELEKEGVFPKGKADQYKSELGDEYGKPEPSTVAEAKYGPRKGEYILLVPKPGAEISKYQDRVKPGYKPRYDYEIVQADYDYQPYYEMYSKAYDAQSKKQYAISKSDTAYLKAVESGDMETAQRMVDEAAEKAGYTVRKYHGTKAVFNTFDADKSLHGASGFGYYFGDKAIADEFGKGGRVLSVLINPQNIGTLKTHNISAEGFESAIEQLGLSPEKTYMYLGADTPADYVKGKHDYRLATDLQYWANDPRRFAADASAKVKAPSEILSILKNTLGLDGIERGRELVLWDNTLMKLADPVTYDDSGNPIPLSERFNPENPDIRYAISKDAMLTPDAARRVIDGTANEDLNKLYAEFAEAINAPKSLDAQQIYAAYRKDVEDGKASYGVGSTELKRGQEVIRKIKDFQKTTQQLQNTLQNASVDDFAVMLTPQEEYGTFISETAGSLAVDSPADIADKAEQLERDFRHGDRRDEKRFREFVKKFYALTQENGDPFYVYGVEYKPQNARAVRYAINKDATLNENLGYHAGDLGKAEYLRSQGRDRGTGHFGTGTYFVGTKEKVTEDSHYGKRPQHAVDFSDYNLYKVRNDRDGYRLHDALRVIDGGLDETFVKKAEAGAFSALKYTDVYDMAKKKFGENLYGDDYEKNMISVIADYANQNGIEIQSREEYLKDSGIDEEDADFYYLDYLKETVQKAVDEVNDEYSTVRKAIDNLEFSFHFDRPKIIRALNKVLEYQKATPRFSKSDSYATVFMKAMGYDGVDVRGTGLDNTGYGSVIYDVKKDTIRYAINKDATIRTESELIDSVIDPKETAKAGVENALDGYLDSIGAGSDIPGMDKISTGTKKNANLPARYKAQEAARFFYRKMVDSGEAVTRLGRYSNDPHLYHYYNMARASSNAAVSMIQDAQTDVMGRRVGDSLNDIFSAIRKKGEQYYADLQAYLYHTHNIDRMSRENPGAVASAQAELEQFRRDNPELVGMADFQIERLANDPISFYHEQAKAYMQILRRLRQAAAQHNKPVFGQEVSAEQSRRAAEDLREKLSETEGFEEDVEKIYQYIDNLMQYRIDSGLITEEEYERLKEIYPHYVPTFREQEPAARNKRGNTTEIGKTVGRAQGGDTRLIPLHRALAQQTFSVVREGSKNRFGQMLLEGKQNNSRGMIKNVEEAEGGFHEDTFDEEDVTPKKENTFIVRQGGKRYEIGMDNALYEAVTALSPEPAESNFLINFVHKSNDLFKALCTGYNPTFLVRNFMRDLQDAGLYSKDLSEFSKNYPLAYKEITTNGKYWQMYKALGGLYSSFFDYQTGELKQSGKVKKYTVDAIESVNMAVEQAPRLAEFMATVKKAEKAGNLSMDTLMEAIYNAADVTVNFGRSGKWGKMFNRSVVPFFNPGVQGFDKMIRNVTETKGFKDWARLAAKATILGIAPAVISRLLFGKRKDWDEIKQRDKDIYYLFPLQDGVWLKLPKGRVLSVFGMAADRAMQGKDADWASFIETSLTQTAPENPLTASYWRPWLDAKLFDKDDPGKTWYGSDIENQRLRNLAPGQRYDTTTDALSKWLGKTFNLSPKKINYLLDQYSGVIGDVLLPLTSDRAEKGLFTNAFTIDSVVSNQLSEDFYDMKDRLTWAKNDPNATGEDEALYKYWNEQTSAISDINKAIRAIEQDKSLTDKEKRDLTRVQYSLRNGIMRNALDSMSDYRAGGTDNDIYSKVSDAQAQEERESKTYNFKGQDVAWDDLSGTQKKIVQAQDAIDNDPNADLSEIIGKGNATKKLAQYQAARDQGISNQTYIDALQAIDDADDGNGNYNQAEAKAGLDKLISDGTISEKEAGTLWKIITGGADKNNPFPVGAIRPMGLRLPKIG